PNFPVAKTDAKFNQPMGLAKAGSGILIVADYGNHRVKVVNSVGTVTNLYGVSSDVWLNLPGLYPGWRDGNVTVPDAKGDVEARLPNGVLLAPNGTVYVTEDYYHLIRMVTGASLPQPIPPPPPAPTILTGLADCGQVSLTWSTSSGATNYNVKRAASGSGPYTTITNTSSTSYTDTSVLSGTTYYYVVSAVGTGGESQNSAPVSATPTPPPAPSILTVLTNFYNQVTLTWSTVPCPGVTYYVKRSPSSGGPYTTITNTASTSYTDTGLLDGTTYYYVVSAFNGGGESSDSAETSATTRCHPVPDPQIGYVDFPFPTYTSVFHPVSSYIAYNDTVLVIKGTPGSGTYYTFGYTTNAAAVPNPTPASASIPSDYQDGLYPGPVVQYTISQVAPVLTVKAIGTKADCSPNSAVTATIFQFKTGNPNLNGINAAQFTISDITANAHLYYTLDSTDPSPTNGIDLGRVDSPTNVWTVGFAITSNTLFNARAFRDN
ncbi:MAG: fibronectin type III domain-containing protein, partial [Verrucomicrobia bacterium]|nr:fibronectin type III domain-containing protein [Verrucomicrobiota bacterium]